jgi:hypothetical protein
MVEAAVGQRAAEPLVEEQSEDGFMDLSGSPATNGGAAMQEDFQ